MPASVTSASSWVTGSDGNIWFINDPFEQPSIGRLAPSGKATFFPLPNDASDLSLAPEGTANSGSRVQIHQAGLLRVVKLPNFTCQ